VDQRRPRFLEIPGDAGLTGIESRVDMHCCAFLRGYPFNSHLGGGGCDFRGGGRALEICLD